MDFTHVHLFLNHLPLIGTFFTLIFLIYFVYKNNIEAVKIFLYVFILLALITIPVVLTGDPAGETVKAIPGFNESVVDTHEDAGWISFYLMEVIGALAIVGLILIKKSGNIKSWFKYSFIILAVISIVSFGRTANLGGEIRHTEIRTNTPQ